MSRRLLLALAALWAGTLILAIGASLLVPGVGGAIIAAVGALSVTNGAGGPQDLVIGAIYGFAGGLGLGIALLWVITARSGGKQNTRQLERILRRDVGRMMKMLEFTNRKKGKAFGRREEPDSQIQDVLDLPMATPEMTRLTACAVCGHAEHSLACEYNRFVTRPDAAPDSVAARYDYSLCHSCGALFALRRPTGDRYLKMLLGFNESLGRAPKKGGLLNPEPLDDETRADLRKRAKAGVFVSEHDTQAKWLPAVLRDRLVNAEHVELIGSLLNLDKPRVLELRPRTGAVSNALRRLYDADAYTMPMFESQQFVVQEYYGLPADHLINYENFEVPYEGPFDLVVSNHILTHIIDPLRYFEVLRSKIRPGGHLYLYNEPDDAEFLSDGSMMFSVLNPFHLQTFDLASLSRALRANGFQPEFVTRNSGGFICLARFDPDVPFEPIDKDELRQRIDSYRRARDMSVVRLTGALRDAFESEWPAIVRRLTADGLMEFDEQGRAIVSAKL